MGRGYGRNARLSRIVPLGSTVASGRPRSLSPGQVVSDGVRKRPTQPREGQAFALSAPRLG